MVRLVPLTLTLSPKGRGDCPAQCLAPLPEGAVVFSLALSGRGDGAVFSSVAGGCCGFLPRPFRERVGVRVTARTVIRPVGRIRRSRRIRRCLPALTQNCVLISPHAFQPFATRWRIVTLAIHFPHRLPRQRFLFFQQRQSRGVIARCFQLA